MMRRPNEIAANVDRNKPITVKSSVLLCEINGTCINLEPYTDIRASRHSLQRVDSRTRRVSMAVAMVVALLPPEPLLTRSALARESRTTFMASSRMPALA